VALCCYAVGLLYALLALTRTSALLNRVALPVMSLGMVFQFVSLTEAVLISGQLTLTSVHNSESLLSLIVMASFMIVYLVYRTTSPGIVVFPLVFVLTFVAATTQQHKRCLPLISRAVNLVMDVEAVHWRIAAREFFIH